MNLCLPDGSDVAQTLLNRGLVEKSPALEGEEAGSPQFYPRKKRGPGKSTPAMSKRSITETRLVFAARRKIKTLFLKKLQCGHSNRERQGFIFTLFVLFITYFITFFGTSQSQPRGDATAFFPPKSVSNVAWDNKNTENKRKNVCVIASVHGCDWLVLGKCKK